MYPFSLIEPRTLLLISIGVFSLSGLFMAIAFLIRRETAYAWLAVGSWAFAVGWSLDLAQFVVGTTLLTGPVAQLLVLLYPLLLIFASLSFLRLDGFVRTLWMAAFTLPLLFVFLLFNMDNEAMSAAATSSLSGVYFLTTAQLFHRYAYPRSMVSQFLVAATVVVGTALMLHTVFQFYGLLFSHLVSTQLTSQLLYTTLFIALLSALAQALCFPLMDFLRTESTLADANRRLTDLAERDGLTGIFNRRVFMMRLEAELHRHKRQGLPLSVILFDIDHFKRVNDSRGHAAGDQVIRRVVELVASHLRSGDTFARYGGEEFTILLPGVRQDVAANIAERMRATVENGADDMVADDLVAVTCSFGVACRGEGRDNADALLEAADSALYRAKSEGRNCVRSVHSPMRQTS